MAQRTPHTGKSSRPTLLAVIIAVICVGIVVLAMHQRTTDLGFIPPQQEWANLIEAVKLTIANVFNLPYWYNNHTIIDNQPYYLETIGRLRSVCLTAICGAAVSVAGAVYQLVFRNDLASPSMLGISSGVNLAVLLMVVLYSTDALFMTTMGYAFSFAATVIILIFVFLAGRLSKDPRGQGRVTLMLLAGCVVAQMSGSIISSTTTLLSQDDYTTYTLLIGEGWGIDSVEELAAFLALLVIGFLPVIILRHSMDALAFPDEEAQTMGISTQPLRFAALIAGSILVTTATVACSNVGVMAILIPHFCRYLFGTKFKHLILSCSLMGAAFLLICRMISVTFSFSAYYLVFTLSSVVGLLSTPLIFIVMILRARRIDVD